MPSFSPLDVFVPLVIFPYPPPIIVKHHSWYYDDADFFIIVRGIVYGLHRCLFEQSSYFRTLLDPNESPYTHPQGTSCLTPIPFDGIIENKLDKFLYVLYHPGYYDGSLQDWKEIQKISLDWCFYRIAALAIRKLVLIQEQELPIQHQHLFERLVNHDVRKRQRYTWRLRRLPIIIESSDEESSDTFDSSSCSSIEDDGT